MPRQSRWLALFVVVAVSPALHAGPANLHSPDLTLLPRAAAPATLQAPDPAARSSAVTVPAGTVLNVRLSQAIDVDSTQAGATFSGLVDDPVMLDGRVVIPRGAAVVIQVARVKQSGTLKGSDQIALKLNSVGFGGRVYDVVTGYAVAQGKGEGARTARKVGAGAGLGAIIGGIADGGQGAAIGAVVGGLTGTIVAASGEEHLRLAAETRVQFGLTAAVVVQP